MAFNNCRENLQDATIVIDGSGSREFRQQLQTYIKGKINDKNDFRACIKKVKIEDSEKNNLLQLTDMICGAVARSFTSKKDNPPYRSLIKRREGHVQFWPK
jgi:mannose/fructose-specific phosphotransferase system component IIA